MYKYVANLVPPLTTQKFVEDYHTKRQISLYGGHPVNWRHL